MRLPPVLFQPMAADDVASAIGRIQLSSPVNATVEIGGPEQFRLDELIRRDLAALKDARQVISDPHARYYDIQVSERTQVPNDGARLGETRFRRLASLYETSPKDGSAGGVSAATANNYEDLTTHAGDGISRAYLASMNSNDPRD